MKRTTFALLSAMWLAGGGAACSKSEPAPAPPTPAPETTPAAAVTPPAGDEANQPRREPEGIAPEAPALSGEQAAIMAAAKLTPGAAVDLGPGAASAEALAYLPDTTLGVMVVKSPRDLLDRFGYAALKASGGEQAAAASAKLIETTGHDLLDPAAWTEMGLDLGAPAGGAMIVAAGEEAFAVFMSVGDRAKLDVALAAAAEKGKVTFEREKIGDAELIATAGYDRNVIVLRGKTVLIAGVEREVGARALGRLIAGQTAAGSVAQATEFTDAVKGLELREDGILWTNLRFAATAMVRGPARVEDAQAQPVPQAERAMMDKVLGPLAGFAVGASVTEQAVELAFHLPLAPEALLRRMFVNLEALPAVFTGSAERPLFALSARLDPKVFLELAEVSLAAEGESLDEARTAAKELGNVDLDRDVFGLFSGEVGFVLQGDLGRAMKGGDLDPSAFGGAFVVGLANPEGLKKLFGVAAGIEGIPKNLKIDPAGTLEIPLPTGSALRVEIAGNALIASTDAEFAKRVAAGDLSASFLEKLDHPGLKALLTRPRQAAYGIMPMALTSFWFIASSASPPPSLVQEQDGARSPERVAKEKELADARARLDALRDKREAEQQRLTTGLFERLGVTASTAEVVDTGLRFRLGQYFASPLSEVVAAVAGFAQAESGSAVELDEAYEAVFKLENEVRNLEVRDDMAKPE